MIEFRSVADASSFTYNRNGESGRSGTTGDVEFSRMLETDGVEAETVHRTESIDASGGAGFSGGLDEMTSYTYFGKKITLGKFTGRTVDHEI